MQKKTSAKKPVAQKKPVRKKKKPVLLLMAVAMLVCLVCFRIYTNAQYNETVSELNRLKKQCEVLQNEQIQLTVRLDSMADLRNIEQIAVGELGMSKIEQHQIEYVNLGSEDRAGVIENDDTGIGGIFRNFAMIWEYLS